MQTWNYDLLSQFMLICPQTLSNLDRLDRAANYFVWMPIFRKLCTNQKIGLYKCLLFHSLFEWDNYHILVLVCDPVRWFQFITDELQIFILYAIVDIYICDFWNKGFDVIMRMMRHVICFWRRFIGKIKGIFHHSFFGKIHHYFFVSG